MPVLDAPLPPQAARRAKGRTKRPRYARDIGAQYKHDVRAIVAARAEAEWPGNNADAGQRAPCTSTAKAPPPASATSMRVPSTRSSSSICVRVCDESATVRNDPPPASAIGNSS